MRRKVAFGLGGACLAIVGSIWLGRASATQPTDPTVTAIETQIAQLQATLTAIALTPEGQGTPVVATFTLDNFSVTVTGAEWLDQSQVPDRSPRGRWAAVRMKVVNNGNEPDSLPDYKFAIRDSKGRTFTMDGYPTGYLSGRFNLLFGNAQPSLEYDAVIVFDVAKDAEGFTLTVEGTDVSVPLGI